MLQLLVLLAERIFCVSKRISSPYRLDSLYDLPLVHQFPNQPWLVTVLEVVVYVTILQISYSRLRRAPTAAGDMALLIVHDLYV